MSEHLLALADMCEKADGPNRMLDVEIAAAVGATEPLLFTGSTDAALTLMPTDWRLEISGVNGPGKWQMEAWAPESEFWAPDLYVDHQRDRLPLDVCCIALRARAAAIATIERAEAAKFDPR